MKRRSIEVKKSVPVSCLECRRRKIKCDRGVVCKSCERKKLTCEYPETFRSIKISPPEPKLGIVEEEEKEMSDVERLRKHNNKLASHIFELEKKVVERADSAPSYISVPCFDESHMTLVTSRPVELPKLLDDSVLNVHLLNHLVSCFFDLKQHAYFELDRDELLAQLKSLDASFQSMEVVMLICAIGLVTLDYSYDPKHRRLVDFDATVDRPVMVSLLLAKIRDYRQLTKYSRGKTKFMALWLYMETRFAERDERLSISTEVFTTYSHHPEVASLLRKFDNLYVLKCLVMDMHPIMSQCFEQMKTLGEKFSPQTYMEAEQTNPADDFMSLVVRVLDSRLSLRKDNYLIMEVLFKIQKKEYDILHLKEKRKFDLDNYDQINSMLVSQMKVLMVLHYCGLKLRFFQKPSDYQLESMVKLLNHILEMTIWSDLESCTKECLPVRNYVVMILGSMLSMFNSMLYHRNINTKMLKLILAKFEAVSCYHFVDTDLLDIVAAKVNMLASEKNVDSSTPFLYGSEVLLREKIEVSKLQVRPGTGVLPVANNFALDFSRNETTTFARFLSEDENGTYEDQAESPSSLGDNGEFTDTVEKEFATISTQDQIYTDYWLGTPSEIGKSLDVTDLTMTAPSSSKTSSFFASELEPFPVSESLRKPVMELNGYYQFMDVE
ncbi:hypothetical protein KL928_003986 [Ogataea angusta]|uniref:Zn(2)-C6 fungal-type domain-containing protein n=1 Tax=Pichia angusta TaxID=870730 RepID=A0AAN6DD11_PICAN|nr:uncharacterized protein KL928_003986 [Ogataea angusta]KAG7817251.1 hypothetical protein KL928_003986 [Ogataea angusta]